MSYTSVHMSEFKPAYPTQEPISVEYHIAVADVAKGIKSDTLWVTLIIGADTITIFLNDRTDMDDLIDKLQSAREKLISLLSVA